MRYALTLVAASLLGLTSATVASAQIEASLQNIDNTSQLTGFITQDLSVNTVNDWVSAAVALELDAGSIYQDAFGSIGEPNYFAVMAFPSLAFDTYLTGGGTWGIGVLGGGGDAGGIAFQFDNQRLDVSWKSNSSTEIGLTRIARITLSDDAQGRWRLAAMQAEDGYRYDITGTIVDGVMLIDP